MFKKIAIGLTLLVTGCTKLVIPGCPPTMDIDVCLLAMANNRIEARVCVLEGDKCLTKKPTPVATPTVTPTATK